MKIRVKIVSYSVLRNAVSIRLLSENAKWLMNEAPSERKRVSLDDIQFEAKIRSLNIQRDGINLLLRTKRSRYIVGRLYDLMGKEANEFSFSGSVGERLSDLLFKVSKKTGESEQDLLYRLTTFRDREGKEILGKRFINDLSEGQKVVVLKKLTSILEERQAGCLGS